MLVAPAVKSARASSHSTAKDPALSPPTWRSFACCRRCAAASSGKFASARVSARMPYKRADSRGLSFSWAWAALRIASRLRTWIGLSTRPRGFGSAGSAGGGAKPQNTRAHSGPKTLFTSAPLSRSMALIISRPHTSMIRSPAYCACSCSSLSCSAVSISNSAEVKSTYLTASKRRGGFFSPSVCGSGPAYSVTADVISSGVRTA